MRGLKGLGAAVVAMVLVSGGLSLVGCNTVEGAGKDTKALGEKVQDTAHDAKN